MTSAERFFLRDDYVSNVVKTAAPDQDYWNERRIETSRLFQHAVYAYVRRLLRSRRTSRVLDIGCGSGRKAARLIIPNCSYYRGIDQASAIDYCKKTIRSPNAEFIVDDLEAPAHRDGGPYNVILCADVIEHLENPRGLLELAHDVLAKDGLLVISTPERDVLHGPDMKHSPNPEHVREWNRREFRQLLEAHRFRVKRQHLAPQFRVELTKTSLRLLRHQLQRPLGYWGCQVATCTKA